MPVERQPQVLSYPTSKITNDREYLLRMRRQ
jgi:hypothetical protein